MPDSLRQRKGAGTVFPGRSAVPIPDAGPAVPVRRVRTAIHTPRQQGVTVNHSKVGSAAPRVLRNPNSRKATVDNAQVWVAETPPRSEANLGSFEFSDSTGFSFLPNCC